MSGGVEASRLKSFVERLERLHEEKQEVADQISDVMNEAKQDGFDVKAIREILRLRRMKAHERIEREGLLDAYKAALGMIQDLPLGQAALSAAEARR